MNCPCCNQKLPPGDETIRFRQAIGVVVRGEKYVKLSRAQMCIAVLVFEARPTPVPLSRLVSALYEHDPNGGPDDAEGVVRVQVNHLNRRLKQVGMIVTGGGKGRRGLGYHFVEQPIAPAAQAGAGAAAARRSGSSTESRSGAR